MTQQEERRCLWLLQRAKQGDASACEQLVGAISRHYRYMLRGLCPADPAYDQDDLLVQFQSALWQNIKKVDHRGNPLFHLAWRGRMAVYSLLQTIRAQRVGTPTWIQDRGERSVGCFPAGWDAPDPDLESLPENVVVRNEVRTIAYQQVRTMVGRMELTSRQLDVVVWFLTDPNIEGKGANQRLAYQLGVSEQAASVYRRKVIHKFEEVSSPEELAIVIDT